MTRVIYQKESLAGKCGIPLERDRVYVEPAFGKGLAVASLLFPDGRSLSVSSQLFCHEYGREFFGNLCLHRKFTLDDDGNAWIDVWEERRRWFVRADWRERMGL